MVLRERVLEVVAARYGVTRDHLLCPTRSSREVAWARQVAMYLLHRLTPGASLTAVGREVGRDRTTVRHAVAKVAAWRDQEDFDQYLEEVERECSAAAVRA